MGHITWDYVKNILSTPKTKDLVNIQTDKYRNIIQELSENLSASIAQKTNDTLVNNEINQTVNIDVNKETNVLSLENQLELQVDLEQFMSEISYGYEENKVNK